MTRRHLYDDQGIAIVSAVLIGAIVFVIAGIMVFRSAGDLNQNRYDRNWQRSLHVADAGIDHVLNTLTDNVAFTTGEALPSFPDLDAERAWVLSTAAASTNLVTVSEGQWVIIKPTGTDPYIYSVGYVPERDSARNTRILRVAYDFAPYSPGQAVITEGDLEINGNPDFAGSLGSAHANGNVDVVGVPNFSGSLSSTGSYNPGGANIGDPGSSGGGYPALEVPEIDPYDNFGLAEYVLCPDGLVRTGPSYAAGLEPVPLPTDPACSGTVIGDGSTSAYRGWRLQSSSVSKGAIWSYTGNDSYDGVYYIDEGSADISGSPGTIASPWNATVFAAPVSGWASCGTIRGGDIDVTGNPVMRGNEKADPFLLVARRDIAVHGNPAGGQINYQGAIVAHQQVAVVGNPSIVGAILANDACDTAGSPVAVTEIGGNASITFDGFEVPLGDTIRITHWNEL